MGIEQKEEEEVGEIPTRDMEVERRILLTPEDKDRLIGQLKELGGEFVSHEDITDTYYCPQRITSFDELEMNDPGSYSLRTRETNQKVEVKMEAYWQNVRISSGDQLTQMLLHISQREGLTQLTSEDIQQQEVAIAETGNSVNMKIITGSDHHATREIEFFLDDLEVFGRFLSESGFKSFFSLRKERVVYLFEDFLIIFDTIDNFGNVLEVELKSDANEIGSALERIDQLLVRLGVDSNSILEKTGTNLAMRKLARFS